MYTSLDSAVDTCVIVQRCCKRGSVQSGVCGVELVLIKLTKVKWVDSIPRGPRSGHRWRVCIKSFLKPFSSLVLNCGNYLFLSGGKELTPLPPSEEKSGPPSPLATLGPLWGANGEGGDTVEKDAPAAEGSQRVGPLILWSQGLMGKILPFLV